MLKKTEVFAVQLRVSRVNSSYYTLKNRFLFTPQMEI